MCCRGDVAGAIELVVADAPYGAGVDDAKVRFHHSLTLLSLLLLTSPKNLNLQTLVSILNSTKATEIPGVIRSLSPDAQDTLMKYLYKGMALPGWGDVSGSVLLGWHEKVCGSIR